MYGQLLRKYTSIAVGGDVRNLKPVNVCLIVCLLTGLSFQSNVKKEHCHNSWKVFTTLEACLSVSYCLRMDSFVLPFNCGEGTLS